MENLKALEQKIEFIAKDSDDGRKRISCASALQISDEFKVTAAIVGQICDDKKIKICKCQLNCFD